MKHWSSFDCLPMLLSPANFVGWQYLIHICRGGSRHQIWGQSGHGPLHVSRNFLWRLRGNIIRTALCWIVWYNAHSLQHTYVSSSYRSNRLGLSHWDPYTVRRGGCLELYYCNMVEWFWCDSSLIFDDQLVCFSALTLLVWSSGL